MLYILSTYNISVAEMANIIVSSFYSDYLSSSISSFLIFSIQ
ncbi:hypothetical protein ECDEC14D_4877 [Escherichia coli DEC14D]|nr:hypothetical protein ECDEC14D_4877 [Escherichia coli DEC14D]